MSPVLDKVIGWLRASYPTGVPERDFQPLLALMRRRLTDDEITQLGQHLAADGLIRADRVDVGVEMTKVTQDLPSLDELNRVMERLRRSGFPVDDWTRSP